MAKALNKLAKKIATSDDNLPLVAPARTSENFEEENNDYHTALSDLLIAKSGEVTTFLTDLNQYKKYDDRAGKKCTVVNKLTTKSLKAPQLEQVQRYVDCINSGTEPAGMFALRELGYIA